MLMIQIAAAVLLVLGSALIFRALLEIDAPTRPAGVARRHLQACGARIRDPPCPRQPEAPC